MTIGAWITFVIISLVILAVGLSAAFESDSIKKKVIKIIIAVSICVGLFFGFRWYFTSTASGRRQLLDQKSDLSNGIERVINIYTANGDIIATYEGKIDIETNDGGYVKFDFDGKRYIYYNCFVETIAEAK